ncbi:cyclohexanecarboxylate-CoA ligase [Azoarcus sp. CIB]|uniref:cyclohexanecarboxylate-CoA ligase n=1 Tax=Aromatoleum sp. (strain CIB) TaxID=198107 RepID=UPI00067E52F9|nr:cyclohexanecarboxylate-CoA ligase [Azoarcus sp. CIB]AKU10937.1 cyclohexanecarboxylate-CoA ligase [Azoarcus sp. CIB]
MDFDAVLLPPRRAACIAAGLWPDRTINDELEVCVSTFPDKIALTAMRAEDGEVRRFTYRELAALADRVAVGLSRLGVGRNDVVAMQLPNWWQFTVVYLACARIGAVINPLMPIFRERELSFMLGHGEAKVLIVPKTFRGFDHEAMARGLQPSLPALKRIVVIDSDGPDSFDALLTAPAWEKEPDAADILTRSRPGPDDITMLMYTSGTTGEPKGAMHSTNTVMANLVQYARQLRLDHDDVVLMASPMAHQTGAAYGMMLPILLHGRSVILDKWEPAKAVELIRAEGATFTMASTPFLTDLTKTVQELGLPVPTLRSFLCSGAPIPPPLVEQARKVLGTKIVSAWGMTEIGVITMIGLDDDDERAYTTDGKVIHGAEVRIVDDAAVELPRGEVGRLVVRTCSAFGGYLKRPQWNNVDADGWLDSGDVAKMDEQGYIRISGRNKDVIIRGGENIPVFEIESLLYRHPAVEQVAIVAYPDERLGERCCAVIAPKAGQTIDFASMVDFLKAQKVAMQYIPERLIVRETMPSTATGKIQKFKLRELLREELSLPQR